MYGLSEGKPGRTRRQMDGKQVGFVMEKIQFDVSELYEVIV